MNLKYETTGQYRMSHNSYNRTIIHIIGRIFFVQNIPKRYRWFWWNLISGILNLNIDIRTRALQSVSLDYKDGLTQE